MIKGTIRDSMATTLEKALEKKRKIHYAAKSVNSDVIAICHGRPISELEDH